MIEKKMVQMFIDMPVLDITKLPMENLDFVIDPHDLCVNMVVDHKACLKMTFEQMQELTDTLRCRQLLQEAEKLKK